MKAPNSNHHNGLFGLRTILVVPFILQLILAVGLTGYLALRNGQQAVNDVAGQLRQEVTARVQDTLRTFLGTPQRINRLHATALATGHLVLGDAHSRELHFGKMLQNFPEVSNTYIGTAQGNFFGARKAPEDGRLQLTVKNGFTNGKLHYCEVGAGGRLGACLQPPVPYDPRQRPWYQNAVAAGTAGWSDIFGDAGSRSLAITAIMPVYDKENPAELQGVLGSALRFNWIDDFLSTLTVGTNGRVFIMQRSGYLVATSKHDPVTFIPTANGKLERVNAETSHNAMVRGAARHLKKHFGDFSHVDRMYQFDFKLDGLRQFVQATPLETGEDRSLGLDWLIVVVVPESDFMGRIHENTRLTILLSVLALVIAVVVGFMTSRWIAGPLLRLNDAAKELALGNWEQKPMHLNRHDEVGQLSASFYTMARQLREIFEHLEEKVQERTRDLAAKNEELRDLNGELVKLNQDKNEFLGIAAHDLKNPLSAIKGLAEEIQEAYDEMPREEVIEYAEKIHGASQKMFALITNLLDVNAIESGKMNVTVADVDMLPVIATLTNHYAHQAQAKGITLQLHHEQDVYLARVDENTSHQILDNLVSNAVKYSPSAKHVDVFICRRDNKIRCEIQDQGPGLNAEDKQKLFGKFNRLSAKPTGGEHSTGLGLFIVKKLVEAMHGEVWCESEPGEGAKFVVEFPAVAG